jgi:hypothetical protein
LCIDNAGEDTGKPECSNLAVASIETGEEAKDAESCARSRAAVITRSVENAVGMAS